MHEAGPAVSPKMQRSSGVGRLGTTTRGETTHLRTLYQEGCCKLRLPRTHGNSLEAVLINTSGGLTGGDEIYWEAAVAPGGRVVITTQACERAYRSTGDAARISVRIEVGRDAHLDWMPQETILFEDSRLERSLDVDLAEGATFTAVEAVLLGREAMGETARRACLRDRWRIRRGGKLIHAEATELAGQDFQRDGLSLLACNNAFATVLAITPHAAEKLDAVRALLPVGAGASVNGGRLVLRALAPSGIALRRILAPAIALLSSAGTLPRLWTI